MAIPSYNITERLMSLSRILKEEEEGKLTLSRASGCYKLTADWGIQRKSKFIESLIMLLPTPYIILDLTSEPMTVIDGLSRLNVIKEYMTNGFHLSGLDYLSENYTGHTFDTLPRSAQRNLEGYELTVHTLMPDTDIRIKESIFKLNQ